MQFYKLTLIIIVLIVFSGCSKLQKELPQPTSPTAVHSTGWNDTASSNFHGLYLKSRNWKKDDCVQCHASDFSGGTSNTSCYGCHQSYPHKAGILDKTSQFYHGYLLKLIDWNSSSCQKCHGYDYNGGRSEVACYQCHNSYPHKSGWKQTGNSLFHGVYLKNNNWNLQSCQNCHGSNYDGGSITDKGCMSSGCHIDEAQNKKSPEACNTCHGKFNSPANLIISWAPPRGIDGSTDSTHRSVGAHQMHLSTGKIGNSLKCNECHNVPVQVFSTGHLDSNLPAEVVMNDTLARLITGNGSLVPNPAYDNVSLRCSNTYCHGNWKLRRANSTNQFGYADSIMVGANYSPLWNGGASEAVCGSCHGLPPTGHIASNINACTNCHTGVVNNAGQIIDKTKHINGKINVFGQEKWMN